MAAGDIPVHVVGNLVADPELRFTASGKPVATFRVASTTRRLNPKTNEWENGDSTFLTCTAWERMAENVAESLQRGMAVIVVGKLKQRNYETKDGEKRTVFEVLADAVGPDLRNASAKITRTERQSGGYSGQPGNGNQGSGRQSPARQDDPWASDTGYSDEPPF